MEAPLSRAIIKDDLGENSAPFGPEDFQQLSELSKYRIDRREAQGWARRDIKFLVYDDTDDTNGVSQPHDGKYREVIPGFVIEASNRNSTDGPVKRRGQIWGKICRHYAAISYAWPEPQMDEDGNVIPFKNSYEVRNVDGTIRINRALDDILDRAVDFAISCGLRMIWIDQECLPQPKEDSHEDLKREQELGIQAMDIVYNRAVVTAGLLAAEITSQAQIDCVRILESCHVSEQNSQVEWHGSTPIPIVDMSLLNHVLDFLDLISSDRWYSRAWVAQESLCAGGGLVLALRRGPGISYPSSLKLDFGDDSDDSNDGSTASQTYQRAASAIIAIPVKTFQNVVRVAKGFLLIRSGRMNNTMIYSASNSPMGRVDRADPVLSTAEALHPVPPPSNSGWGTISIMGGTSYGPRQALDAATALVCLKTRACRDIQDRIAIVSNMCNYDIRLDTGAVARNCRSLRIALVALTMLNGDYTILVPEAYALKNEDDMQTSTDFFPEAPSPQWLFPLNSVPHLLDYCKFRHSNLVSFAPYSDNKDIFSTEGVRLRAYMRVVNQKIDFKFPQREWKELWGSIQSFKIGVNRQKEETNEECMQRRRLFMERFTSDDPLRSRIMSLLNSQSGPVLEGSPVLDGSGTPGLSITNFLYNRVERDPELQRTIGMLFFVILMYLYNNRDSFPQALYLANSIWQSVRIDAVPGPEDKEALPDVVGERLWNHPDVIENPFQVLQLDKTRDSTYSQIWLIDRIMQQGYLWVGRYIPSPAILEMAISEEPNNKNPASIDLELDTSILKRQIAHQMEAILAGSGVFSSGSIADQNQISERGVRTLAFDLKHRQIWSHKAEERRFQQLVSVFEVDGPCLVSTPYNREWEYLPHPELRSASICWVVESRKQTNDHHSGVRTTSTKPTMGVSPTEPHYSKDDNTSSVGEPAFQVVRKVRGMWQVMDLPSQEYTFC